MPTKVAGLIDTAPTLRYSISLMTLYSTVVAFPDGILAPPLPNDIFLLPASRMRDETQCFRFPAPQHDKVLSMLAL
jgi:hypothetical protein